MNKIYFLSITILVVFSACRKTDTTPLTNDVVVQSAKQPGADFSLYKTYFIPDTIALKTSIPFDSIWFGSDAKQLVDAVKQNMNARGFMLAAGNHSHPDLGLGLMIVEDLNVSVIYPGWLSGYWGSCYWGYCGYPGYYPLYGNNYDNTIPTGTIILSMIDLKNATADGKLTVPWLSLMSGDFGDANDLTSRVKAINRAFEQSPYIETH